MEQLYDLKAHLDCPLFEVEFRHQVAGEVVDLNLTEIVTAFIGGEYA